MQALHPSKTASHLVMKANKKEKRKKEKIGRTASIRD
jgi:hypothetical protein